MKRIGSGWVGIALVNLSVIAGATAADLSSCDENSLRAAINGGGVVSFPCDGIITVTSPFIVTNNVTLEATGRDVTLSGGGSHRVFVVEPGASLTAVGLKIVDGRAEQGGGILNHGTVTLDGCVFRNNQALPFDAPEGTPGASGYGGAIANDGVVSAVSCVFSNNVAEGGKGGRSPEALASPAGPGQGGAILNDGTLYVQECVFKDNRAVGVDEPPSNPGSAGQGGAIANRGTLGTMSCLFSNNAARGGTGGAGEYFAISFDGGPAEGGAIWSTQSAYVTNSQFLANEVIGGVAGDSIQSQFSAAGGNASGGAVSANGMIILANCSLSNNRAEGGPVAGFDRYGGPGGSAIGGAIQSAGALELSACTFQGNSATGGVSNAQSGYGGDGEGGGIACTSGTADIRDCVLENNVTAGSRDWAYGLGGGFYNNAQAAVLRTSFLTNSVAGGRAGRASPVLIKAGAGRGGAIYNANELRLEQSTLAYNRAQGGSGKDGCVGCSPPSLKLVLDGGDGEGGGIYNAGMLGSTNNTIAANQALRGPAYPGGIGYPAGLPGLAFGNGIFNASNGIVWLIFNTVAGNAGPAASIQNLGSMQVMASILEAGSGIPNLSGTAIDAGYNLSSDNTPAFTAPTSHNNTDSLLGPLANNGSPTLTLAPLPGSPAIDSGEDASVTAMDQRGVARPQGNRADVGAVEVTFLTIQNLGDDELRVRYSGIPGTRYMLEGTPALGEAWVGIEIKTAEPNGVVDYTTLPKSEHYHFFRVKSP